MKSIPKTMRAAAIARFGGPSQLKVRELPVPVPGPSEILIAVATAGIGGWDASIRDGSVKGPGRPRFPLIPGVDGAGRVAATGARVTRFHAGDSVYAYEFDPPHVGFYAEFAVVHQHNAARLPRGWTPRNAGAVAATGLTAMQGVRALALRRRETVLIFGATGAVGTLAVQFARLTGAYVIATASGAAAARTARRLGANEVVDARARNAAERLEAVAPRGVDAVLALAGGESLERCLAMVRTRARIVYPNGINAPPRRRRRLRISSFDAVASAAEFARLNRWIVRARLRPVIARRFPLTQAAAAHRALADRQIIGRIVLDIRP